MRHRFSLTFCLALAALAAVAALPPVAIGQTVPGQTELGANAALQYWQAFAQMPNLDKEQEKLLQDWNNVDQWQKLPLHPEAQKLVDASHSSLMMLHRGWKQPRCDWGLDYGDGMSLMLPHLAKSRDLARLAALRARMEFERGNYKFARNDATAIMALARHVGRDPIMICVLVRYGLEGIVVDLVAPYVPDIKASHEDATGMLAAMPAAANVRQTLPAEKKYMAQWAIDKLKAEEAKKPSGGLELWKKFMEGAEIPDSLRQINSLSEVIALMEKMLPVYDELERLVALPPDQFDAQYPSFKERTKAANPVAGTFLPAVDQLLAKERRHEARIAMLLAGIAFVEGGEAKLKTIKDPFGTGPFEYRALDKGFELKSKYVYEGQPVTLTIGQRK
jgi:hypothetical protein